MIERLEELRQELAKGQKRLEMLDRERQEVRDTLLRISGAIQVLEELLRREKETEPEAVLQESAR
jgi:prefoldin subunit 5